MSNDKEFPKGFYFNARRDTAPDFVLGGAKINNREFAEWLLARADDETRLSFNMGREGKPYAVVDAWKPKTEGNTGSPARRAPDPRKADELDDIPFITNTGIF